MIKGIDFPSKKQWMLISAILVLVIFYLYRCRPVPTPQTITTTKILKDTLRLIEQDRKKIEDSFNLVLQKHYKADEFNNGQFVNLVNQNEELAAINEKMQMELSYPDTCREVVNKLNSSYNTYVAQTKQTIEQSKKSLSNLRQTIETQKSYLTEKDKLYARLKSTLDTCIANNAALEKYAKQLKPKRELGLMVSGMNDFSDKNLNLAIGGGLTYKNRRGLQFSISYYSNKTGSISIIKPFARF